MVKRQCIEMRFACTVGWGLVALVLLEIVD